MDLKWRPGLFCVGVIDLIITDIVFYLLLCMFVT